MTTSHSSLIPSGAPGQSFVLDVLGHCNNRHWDERGDEWTCSLDGCECDSRTYPPRPPSLCPRFARPADTRHRCPICIKRNRLTNLLQDQEADGPGLLACPDCGYLATPDEWRSDMAEWAQRLLTDFNAWFTNRKAAEAADAREIGERVHSPRTLSGTAPAEVCTEEVHREQ